MADIEIPAVIDKADITPLGKIKGSSNASPAKVGGIDYAVGTLCFRGFSGTCSGSDTSKYHGAFRFDHADGKDHANRKHFDFLNKPATKAGPAKPARRGKP